MAADFPLHSSCHAPRGGRARLHLAKENSAEIHQTVSTKLEEKVENGGADKIEQEINKFVADGKLSEWQAEKIKEALKDSYEKLQAKLKELSKEQSAETPAE